MSAKVNAPQDLKAKRLDRSATDIAGTLGCYARLIVTGRLVEVGPPDALPAQRRSRNRRCFAWGGFAEPLRDQGRAHALRLARAAGLASQPLERQGLRQATRGAALFDKRGRQPGLVLLFSALESCKCFKPWHAKKRGRTGRKLTGGRCRHCYFYFLAEPLGRGCVRGPTGQPFRRQVYFNQHTCGPIRCALTALPWHWPPTLYFVACAAWPQAPALVDHFEIKALAACRHTRTEKLCPVVKLVNDNYSSPQCQLKLTVIPAYHLVVS